jgi:tripartite-type tricarboxylate transporter receptor subunit TctC
MNIRMSSAISCAAFAAALCTGQALAQTKKPLLPDGYPSRPVRILVSTTPGGGLDIVGRALAIKLGDRTGASFIVDNQAGANGAIAVNTIAAAAPDGYNILCTGSSMIINAVFKRFERDVRTTLAPVVSLSSSYYFLISPNHMPGNLKDFIAYVKKSPGKYNYGSGGVGSAIHLGLEMFEAGAGLDMIHVPYKGVAQVNIDLAAGRLDVALVSLSGIQSVKAGKAKLLATSMPQRHPDHPNLPALAEIIPGYEVANTYMLYAPIATPVPIVAALNRESIQVLAAQDMKDKLAADGAMSTPPNTPEELKKLMTAEYQRWESVINKAGVKPGDD